MRCFVFVVLGWLVWCAGENAAADSVDRYIQERMQHHKIPGLALAIVEEGRTVKTQGYGLANIEHGVPVTPQTVFEIGSITKQFTASLVLLLAESGKLRLDDPITRYLDPAPPQWQKMTLRHLLTHTSGLTNYTGLDGFEVRARLDAAGFIRRLALYPPLFEPGAAWSYCNSGYNLLGYAIEKATGQSYWQALEQRIFKPINMRDTRSRDLAIIITNRADGYEFTGGDWQNRDSDLTDVFAAGALASTVLDLAKWNVALDQGKMLSPAFRDQLWTATKLNGGTQYPYGLGWHLEEFQGRKTIGHSGSTSGFSSACLRFPDRKRAVVVLCNLGEVGLANKIARGIAYTLGD